MFCKGQFKKILIDKEFYSVAEFLETATSLFIFSTISI